jgi:hypothetical protein
VYGTRPLAAWEHSIFSHPRPDEGPKSRLGSAI